MLKRPLGSVVAIHGPWGSGKSSVINLVRHHLAQDANAPVVATIQAWWYRKEDALAIGFFQELYATLSKELPKGEKAKDALARLGGHIAGAGQLLGAAADLVTGTLAEGAVNAVSPTVANYIRNDENTDTLQRRVADALAAQDKRFLFIVDDLDCLSPDEALVVLRLIKSVGRLPNVAYCSAP
nr:P-loop NTPase fold protein [Paracoccus sp. IB05]